MYIRHPIKSPPLGDAGRELRAPVEAHWRSAASCTDPIDETAARAAIEKLAVAVWPHCRQRKLSAVICLASPFECLVAVGFLRGPVMDQPHIAGGMQLAIRALLQDFPNSEELTRATPFGLSITTNHMQAIGAPLDAALRRFAWRDVPDVSKNAAAAKIAHQVFALPASERQRLFRKTGRRKNLPGLAAASWRNTAACGVETSSYHAHLADYDLAQAWRRWAGMPLHQPVFAEALRRLCAACGWFWLAGDVAFVSDRPEVVHLDAQGRAHAIGEAAIRYRDGFEIFAVNGVELESALVRNPSALKVETIEREGNAERRRAMVSLMGVERYLHESGAKRVHEDETGVLWKRSYMVLPPHVGRGRERAEVRNLCFVEVANGTQEPDGTRKRYFLRVPPSMLTARAAVAWTYGLSEDQYTPTART